MRLSFVPLRSVRRVAISLPLVAALVGSVSCLPDGGGPTPSVGTIAVVVSAASAQAAVNAPGVMTVQVTRSGGFTGSVILTADSLPVGVTVTFEPAVLGTSATAAVMTIAAATTAVPGTKDINIRASATDITQASDTVALTIVSGAFTFASGANTLSIPQGTSGSVPLILGRQNGFIAGINLTADGLPPNVTATFTPALLPNGTVGSTLTLAVAANALPGTSTVTVRARGTGAADKTVPLELTINSSASTDYALTAPQASTGVVAGTTGQTVLTVNPTIGFSGNVTFALTGMPNGVTGTFTPNPSALNTTTLAITTTTATVPGTYTMLVTGSTPGLPPRTLPIILTVKPIPAVTVTLFPTTLSIAPDGFAQAAILLTRVGGLTGDFVMTAEGLPAGITATFTPSVVIGNAAIVTLAATATAVPAGNIVIKATAGSDVGSTTVPLTARASALRQ